MDSPQRLGWHLQARCRNSVDPNDAVRHRLRQPARQGVGGHPRQRRPLEHSAIRQTSPFGEDSLQSSQRTTGASKPVPHRCANADGLLHARRPGRQAPRLSSHRLSPPVGKSVATRKKPVTKGAQSSPSRLGEAHFTRQENQGRERPSPPRRQSGSEGVDRLPADPGAHRHRSAARSACWHARVD